MARNPEAPGAGCAHVTVRGFLPSDADALVGMLKSNGQFSFPEIDGAVAMERVARCDAALFLVAESGGKPAGMLRAVYDGSRAVIHQVTVDPALQGRGIGRLLLKRACEELRRRGAPTVTVTVTDASAGYWGKLGFRDIGVRLLLNGIDDAAGGEAAR